MDLFQNLLNYLLLNNNILDQSKMISWFPSLVWFEGFGHLSAGRRGKPAELNLTSLEDQLD